MFIAKTFRKETSPSLVYTLLKLVANKECAKEDVERLLSGGRKGDSSADIIRQVFAFTQACQLIKVENGKVVSLMPKEHLKSYEDFTYAFGCEAFKATSNDFVNLSQWFLAENIGVTKLVAEKLAAACSKIATVEKDGIYGWQDWMVAFGLATYVTTPSDNIMFDCHVRIRRFLERTGVFKKNEVVGAKAFMTALVAHCPEFSKVVNLRGNYVGDSVSISLRILHTLGVIEIQNKRDSTDIWHLTDARHAVNNDFTDIIVRVAK